MTLNVSKKLFCLILLFSVSEDTLGTKWPITLTNNGYEELLVAIHPDISSNQTLLDSIMDGFTEASVSLFKASNNRAYFRNITILVPDHWEDQPHYQPVNGETFEKANVRVAGKNLKYGDTPYTYQIEECGKGGEYMHLTPEYLTDIKTSFINGGQRGKVIVHEWGHLRWGLFDEYPKVSEGDKPFYSTGEGFRPSRCSESITGKSKHRVTGSTCRLNFFTFLPEDNCRFFPDVSGNKGKDAMMYAQYVDTVEQFCSSSGTNEPHNARASNQQNRLCQGRSAWDVMLTHADFINGSNPSVEEILNEMEDWVIPVDPTPTFKIVHSPKRRVVLLLDVSGSMQNERLEKMRQSAFNYLQTLPNGTFLGMTKFSTSATLLAQLTEINTGSDRDAMIAHIPASVGGSTCIGCALQMGYEILSANGADPSGGELILLSDGAENKDPRMADIQPTLVDNRVRVNTIAYSAAADLGMTNLSIASGGVTYFYSGAATSTALGDALTDTALRTTTSPVDTVIVVDSLATSLTNNMSYAGSFLIDASIGKDTSIAVSYDALVTVVIQGPDGTVISDTSSEYVHYPDFKVLRINMPLAAAGEWTYTITPSGASANIEVHIHSKASSHEGPVQVESTMTMTQADFSDDMSFGIFATVTKAGFPVTKANVNAVIECPDNTVKKIKLKDNGAGPDVAKNDGTYSAYFVAKNVVDNGRYSVKVEVKNDNDTEIQVSGQSPGAALAEPVTGDSTFENVDHLSRSGSAGSLTLSGFPQIGYNGPDMNPPARIVDLEVIQVIEENRTVTIQWTAVGDDLDQGTAFMYEIRASLNFDMLLHDFNNGTVITQGLIHVGNLTGPIASGETEMFTFAFPEMVEDTFSIAVVTYDDANNRGGVSNLVTASTVVSPPEVMPLDGSNGVGAGEVAAIVICSLLALIALVGVLLFVLYKKGSLTGKTAPKPDVEQPPKQTETVE